jgi:hypothetical protein
VRRAWRIGGTLLTAVALVWGLVQVVGVLGRSTATVDVSRDATGIEELVVEVAGGSVEIRGTDEERVRVRGEVTSGLTSTRHREQRDGERFVVSSECVGGPLSTFCAVDHVIEVPHAMPVVVRSSETSVTLEGLTGEVDVETRNEGVRGDDLSGPEVRIETQNAPVQLRSVRSPVVSVRTSNDAVVTAFDEPVDTLDIDTSNGEVEVVLPDTPDPYAVRLDTSNGAQVVSVRTDPTAPRRVTARTSNDDVTVRYAERG